MENLVERARAAHALVETHASWVLLTGHFVFKLKKPVDFGFLDFRTLQRRRHFCNQELTLNSRLAGDVYLGVVPVRDGPRGSYIDDPDARDVNGHVPAAHDTDAPGLASESDSSENPIVDWAVKMRRLQDSDRADVLLKQGLLDTQKVQDLAELLVKFHANCETNEHIASLGSQSSIAINVQENFDKVRPLIASYAPPSLEPEIEALQLGYLESHAELFEERVRLGHVRDGHGDLRLEHVYFTSDGIFVIDCIEFNERFRYADTVADLAFLTMDLRHNGRADLAELLLNRYVERSGDYNAFQLIDFYESYRAYVRGKVAALRETQEEAASGHPNPELVREASRFFQEALTALQAKPEKKRVVAVGGLIASGKSTVARQFSSLLGSVWLDSDSCRKRLAGLTPLTAAKSAAFGGIYSAEMSERVYRTLLAYAQGVLASGRSVVIDATFRRAEDRKLLRQLCEEAGVALSFVWCEVPRKIAEQRLNERSQSPSVSDGHQEIYDALLSDATRPKPEEFAAAPHRDPVQLAFLDTSETERVSSEVIKLVRHWHRAP
jgi:uncharacterized protein